MYRLPMVSSPEVQFGEGGGFDFNNLPDPTSPENLEKVKGRGIFLIKNLSDKAKFKNGGRVVDMLFKL